jgi:uncharacterized protein
VPAARLQGDLALVPELAEAGLLRAGKDISQGGIAGTALMLAESSSVAIDIELDRIVPPAGVAVERWLRSFPSFGFLLAAPPALAPQICARFGAREIRADVIGSVHSGSSLRLTAGGESATLWDHAATPYLGLSQKEVANA